MFRLLGGLSIGVLILGSSLWAQGVDFGEEVVIHRDNAPIEFSRNTRGVLGVDSTGRVHLVYGIPNETLDPPDNQIWYIAIVNGQASPPIRVDSGPMGGGKHPSLAIDSENTVHVVWQDYRHTTGAGNYIDNIEIYYDHKPANGSFSDTDVRISYTNADHMGDNGYVPKIAIGPGNRLHIIWYDFTRNGNNADVYLRTSTDQGEFPPHLGIEAFRITDIEPSDEYTANWMPDVAALPDGSVYTIWGFLQGWQGKFQLQGRSIDLDGALGPVELVAEDGGIFSDPPRLASDKNGNLGLVYMRRVGAQSIVLFQYRSLDGWWSEPVVINDGAFDAGQPDLAFDSEGTGYVVWQEDHWGADQIQFATIDAEELTVESRRSLSRDEADARTPAIAIDPVTDQIHVVWIDRSQENEWSVMYRTQPPTAVDIWRLH